MSNSNFSVWDGSVANGFAGGTGTENNPYLINTASQLAYLREAINGFPYSNNKFYDKYYKLTCNLDLNKIEWTPIGTGKSASIFFDGDNHIVQGLYINQPDMNDLGIFGWFTRPTIIKNIIVEDGYVRGNRSVGGVIGHVEEDADASIIENCSFSGEVYGNHRVGGIIGLGTGTLKDCVNYAKVVCDYAGAFSGNVGGLSGDFHGYGSTGEGGYITNCANYGNVFCETGAAGGILGTTRDITMLRYCRNYGNVKGSYVGGITGQMGSFEYCQNSGNITSQSTDGLNAGAGGITSAILNGYVKNCFNSGTITGVKGIGGIISHAIIGSTISCSKNVGRIQGTGNNVGGIAGEPKGIIIECCINEGSVEGDTYVGGIAGLAKSAIKHCSNNGLVKGFRNVGGIGGEGSLFEYCMNDGQISANNAVGGIVGNTKGDVLDCVNNGHIQSSYGYASGISGTGGKTIKNCYNTGRISGLTGLGGIIGKTDVDGFLVENCYNSGKIDPCPSSGGIIGYAMNNGGQVRNSYYLESSVDKAIGSYWMSITVDFKDSPVSTTDLKSMPELLLGSYIKLAVAIPILFWSKKKEMLLHQLSKLDAISSSLCIDQEDTLLTEMSGDDMYVVTEHSLVRESSDETSNVLAMCFENDIIKVLPKQRSNVEDYHKILLDNGQTGFISHSNVMPNYEICTVVCPTVIMDHIGGNILFELFEGDEVKVVLPRESQQIAIGQSWVKVRYENIFGWCLDLDLKEKIEGSGEVFTLGEGIVIDEKVIEKLEEYYIDPTVKYEVDNDGTCVFSFEGWGSYSHGTNTYHPQGMYGAIMVVTKGQKVVYVTVNASTLPDDGSKSQVVQNGVYKYNSGLHKSTYVALRHDATPKLPTWNDGVAGTGVGFNIHAGGNNPSSTSPWSEGCQIIHLSDYVSFGKEVGYIKQNAPNVTDYASIKGLGSTYLEDITVIYILDRSMMNTDLKDIFKIK